MDIDNCAVCKENKPMGGTIVVSKYASITVCWTCLGDKIEEALAEREANTAV